jgi:hypothetical protein
MVNKISHRYTDVHGKLICENKKLNRIVVVQERDATEVKSWYRCRVHFFSNY